MMNIPPSEADMLDLPTYEMILQNWNEAHDTDPDAPDPLVAIPILDAINADPRLIN